jgi:TonB family protein
MSRLARALLLTLVSAAAVAASQVEIPSTSDRAVLDRARVLKKPGYPAEARNAGLVGTVAVRVILGPDGDVVSARAIAGPDGLRAPTVKAVQGWEFARTESPDTLSGILIFQFAAGEDYATIVGVREQELAVAPGAVATPRPVEAPKPAPASKPAPPPQPAVQRIADLTSRATRRVPPEYPAAARRAYVEGLVVVEVEVDERGRVVGARALSGNAMLRDAAVRAAREWTFEPAETRVLGTIAFNFRR